MESVPCNLCGSLRLDEVYRIPDAHFHPDEWFSVVECQDCGLGFVNPRPTVEEIHRYYPPAFYDYFSEHDRFNEKRYRIESTIIEKAARNPGRSLLDVGCANGDFPRYMAAKGWSVEGVEVSKNSRQDLEFTVYRTQFPEIPVDEPRYDVVTAWAVLEHVHDPHAYFEKVARVLRPGGAFVFLVTNFESASSRLLFREDVPRHLVFFTPDTVRRYLSESGLELESIECSDRVYEMRPVGWLVRAVRRVLGLPYDWKHASVDRESFAKSVGIRNRWLGVVLYSLRHPVRVVDRVLLGVYEWFQMRNRTYGISIYIARKS